MKRKAGAENPPRAQGRLGRNLSRGFGAGILPGRALSPIIAMSEPGRWRNSSLRPGPLTQGIPPLTT